MNVTDFTFLINKPDVIHEKQAQVLEKIIVEFPYFQSARALYLKGLYNQNSFLYNNALKITAAFTTDRTVLFDFITSDTFTAIQKELYDKKTQELLDITVIDSFEVVSESEIKSTIESIAPSVPEEVLEILEVVQTPEEKLAIGTPIDFSRNEQHSFQEWLQLSRFAPIDRETNPSIETDLAIEDPAKKKKLDLIDKFIESSPKIPPVKQNTQNIPAVNLNTAENSSLMTETLAKVYLEQKKYLRAIQAYEILILKYPEKSSFFANRISDIKNLQQNNN